MASALNRALSGLTCLGTLAFVQPALAQDLGLDVYILAGQSNMSGRGRLDDLTDAERAPDPAILLYGNDGRLRVAAEPLDDATDQVDQVSADRLAAVGPGLFFARVIRQRHGRPVLLIPCAKGGSAIEEWQPSTSRATLYGSCTARIREAGGRVAGVLWYQGETDSDRPAAVAEGWGQAFARLVAQLRADLRNPDLPITVVQISDRPDTAANRGRFAHWDVVQRQQGAVDLPCTVVVPTRALSRNADDLHLATDAQRIVGGLLAQEMGDLQARGCR